jgi:four helix bundle protein
MQKIEKFEDLLVWQKAKKLILEIYPSFVGCNDFSFRDQIRRASVSIMNNIAEGYERKGNKEFRKFLYISKGSCGEVRSMLYLAKDLGYIDENVFEKLFEECVSISRMLFSLIKKLD